LLIRKGLAEHHRQASFILESVGKEISFLFQSRGIRKIRQV